MQKLIDVILGLLALFFARRKQRARQRQPSLSLYAVWLGARKSARRSVTGYSRSVGSWASSRTT